MDFRVRFNKPYGEYGYLSNHYLSDMEIGGIKFVSVYQYLLYKTAIENGMRNVAREILSTSDDLELRKCSYRNHLKGGTKKALTYMTDGIRYKFESNQYLMKKFVGLPDNTVFLYCNCDRVLGTGLLETERYCIYEGSWTGRNLLGTIMSSLLQEYKMEVENA